MQLKNKEKRDYDDDGLLPLVNIIFLLLIFFMIVGVIEENIVRDNMQLPKVELDKFENEDVTKIFFDADKNIYINDEITDIDGISKKINSLKVTDVVLIADKSLLISEMNSVLLELKKNRINNIKLLSTLNAN